MLDVADSVPPSATSSRMALWLSRVYLWEGWREGREEDGEGGREEDSSAPSSTT